MRQCRFLLAAASIVALPLFAQAQTEGNAPTEDAADAAVQPEAIKALDEMAAHLRTLKQFRLTAAITDEDVLEDGQAIEIAGRAIYEVRVPDKLKIELVTDEQEREYYYDGKSVTQYAPALDYYSVFEAPETIAKMLDAADERYDLQIPLTDLFRWGTERSNVKSVSSAHFVGESRIGDGVCNHYAYRTQGADFQVWIRKGGDPLPCRLVVTDTTMEARPKYAATISWEPDVVLGESIFAFAPPPGASKIEQEPVEAGGN
jgi:hypothetical protein